MDTASPLATHNFRLVHQLSCERRLGSVIVYKRNDFASTTTSVKIELTAPHQIRLSGMYHVRNILSYTAKPTLQIQIHSGYEQRVPNFIDSKFSNKKQNQELQISKY